MRTDGRSRTDSDVAGLKVRDEEAGIELSYSLRTGRVDVGFDGSVADVEEVFVGCKASGIASGEARFARLAGSGSNGFEASCANIGNGTLLSFAFFTKSDHGSGFRGGRSLKAGCLGI